MSAPSPTTQIANRLQLGPFVNGEAAVMLEGEQIATMFRCVKWFDLMVLGKPWAGGKTVAHALRSVAVAYHLLTLPNEPAACPAGPEAIR